MIKKRFVLSALCLTTLNFSSCTKEKVVHMDDKMNTPSSSRGIASGGDVIANINQKIIAMDSPYKVIPLLKELETLASQKDQAENASLQIYNILARPVAKLDGIIWRCRKIVEKSGVLHMAAVGAITKAFHRDYMYGPHVKALLDYATGPSTTGVKMFDSVGEAQDFLETELKPELVRSLNDLTKLAESVDNSWSLNFDGLLLSGQDAQKNIQFISEKHRYKKVVKPHLYYGISTLNRAIGAINYGINYNVEQIPEFVNKLVAKTAVNNSNTKKELTNGLPQTTTPKEASEVLFGKKLISRKGRFAKFLTLRKDRQVADANLKAAMNNFKMAASYEKMAIEKITESADMANASQYVINPEFLVMGKESTIRRLNQMISLYESAEQGKAQMVTSETTGGQTKVNIAALFTAHPDLKVFLPKKDNFSSEARTRRLKWKSGREEISWNYNYGKPISYPDPTFAGFLPEATNANIFSIARDMKLTESLKVFSDYLPIP